jgi:ubiquinone/menaquinone biosynthesis C-methylase UbiE
MQPEYQVTAQHTWDIIAESFDSTRQRPWRYCLDFIETLDESYQVMDLGCGNGRHLLPCAVRCSQAVGLDISQKLLCIVQKKLQNASLKNVSLVHADAVQLPFAPNVFDAALFIASLHNIKGRQHRQAALDEMWRVLKPQGTALISVWSRWQDKYFAHFLKQWIRRENEFGDIEVYWRHHALDIPRFYHLYGKSEFRHELWSAGFKIERMEGVRLHSKRLPDNYFAVVRKR